MSNRPETASSVRSQRSWNLGSRVVSEMNSSPWVPNASATATRWRASRVPGVRAVLVGVGTGILCHLDTLRP